jgi:hypothetical protein
MNRRAGERMNVRITGALPAAKFERISPGWKDTARTPGSRSGSSAAKATLASFAFA